MITDIHPQYPQKTDLDQRAKRLRFISVSKKFRYDDWERLPIKEKDYFRALIVVENYALGNTPNT
jgi:hypothetical protein|tara:strand:- start:434 stop:628 length:195 start_codon:yes stop_codon:yes gene_type:complete